MKTSTRPGRSLRRYVSLAAAGALMLALMPVGQAAATHAPDARDTDNVCSSDDPDDYNSEFDDVGSGPHWVNIVCMADRGITEGTNASNGESYAPRRAVTRGQMSSFIVRFIEDYQGDMDPNDERDQNAYEDVPDEDDYVHAENINKLTHHNIVQGFTDETFRPNQDVNRMQMGSFIRHAISWIDNRDARDGSEPPSDGHDYFSDVECAPAHEDNVNAIAGVGIVEGYSAPREGEYGCVDPILRDQMASFVMRAYDYVVENQLGQEEPAASTVDLLEVTPDTVEAGEDVDVTFDADFEGAYTYTLEFRDSDDTDGAWTDFEGDDASGTAADGEQTVTVTVPEGTGPGDYDARVTLEDSDSGDVSTDVLENAFTVEVVPDGATIMSSELDTRDVAADAEDVSEGDEWVITFSEPMETPLFAESTDTPGTTFTLDDADGEEFTVECVADAGDAGLAGSDIAALCEFDDSEQEVLRIELLEGDADLEYDVTITDTDLETQDGEGVDVEASAAIDPDSVVIST